MRHNLREEQLEEARTSRRKKKLNPKMVVSGRGMKRFAKPRKISA